MKKREKNIKRLAWGAIFAFFCFVSISLCVFITFFATNSVKREVVVVPLFVGMAQNEIKEDGRFDIELDFAYSDSVPEGVVISQTPAPASRRKIAPDGECQIRLVVSLGRETSEMPQVVGMSYNAAVAALRQAGFSVRIVPVYREDVENDTVVGSSPNGNGLLDKGDRVTLYVSRVHVVKTVEVESYFGLEKEVACRKILESGLNLRIIECEYSDEIEAGRVIEQSLPEGSRLKFGSYIDITVSAGKEPCEEDGSETIEE